jgi:CheY-like chemotaxis protein
MPRKNILVVDDEKSQREILEMILSGEGYDVTTAASGEAALKFAKDRRFDLALTDLKMTGMDGIELLQQLLAHSHPAHCARLDRVGERSTAARRVRLPREALRQIRAAGNNQSRARSPGRDRHRDHLRVPEDGVSEKDDSESGALKLDGAGPWRVGYWQGVDCESRS